MYSYRVDHNEAAAIQPRVRPSDSAVKSVSEGRYSLIYSSPVHAVHDARVWKSGHGIIIPAQIQPREDGQLLLDVSVTSTDFQITLLCKSVGQIRQGAVIEWVARRRTDAELLELWIDMLAESCRLSGPKTATSMSGVTQIFGLCRRSLASNPFVALDVSRDATPPEIEAQYSQIIDKIDHLQHLPGVSSRAVVRISQARVALRQVYQLLQSAEGREWARARFP